MTVRRDAGLNADVEVSCTGTVPEQPCARRQLVDQRDKATNDGVWILTMSARERKMSALLGAFRPNVMHQYLVSERGDERLEIRLGPDVDIHVQETRLIVGVQKGFGSHGCSFQILLLTALARAEARAYVRFSIEATCGIPKRQSGLAQANALKARCLTDHVGRAKRPSEA